MCVTHANDPWGSESRTLECRVLLVQADIQTFHLKAQTSADPYDQPIAEGWKGSKQNGWSRFVPAIGLGQGYPDHITSLHDLYSGLGSSSVMPLMSGSSSP